MLRTWCLGRLVIAVLLIGPAVAHAQHVEAAAGKAASARRAPGGLHVTATASASALAGTDVSTEAVDVAAIAGWTRAGVDRRAGFRGPRWTNRLGAQVAARASLSSDPAGFTLEQRSELGLFAFSIGQLATWRARPRLTDRRWWRDNERIGAFVDFPGFGTVSAFAEGDTSIEMFAARVEVTRGLGEDPARGFDVEFSAGRLVGAHGDARILSGAVRWRARTMELEQNFIDLRDEDMFVPLRPWRLNFAVGMSLLYPDVEDINQPGVGSGMPTMRLGLARPARSSLRALRSEIGRPWLDATSVGVELSTLHRLVEDTGVDAGGQVVAWWEIPLDDDVTLRGEAMLGAGARQLQYDAMTRAYRAGGGEVGLARGDLTLRWTPSSRRGLAVEAQGWSEHSERGAQAFGERRRWSHGLRVGLSWSRG